MRQLQLVRDHPRDEVLLEVVQRLWQTKHKSISLIENWSPRTTDFDVRTGLKAQLADERHNLRLLGEEIVRRGGKAAATRDPLLSRAFAIVQAQANDAYRLCGYYLGVKAFTLVRYGHLIPMVDSSLARLLEQTAREEERHIRWADIRIARGLALEDTRQARQLVERIDATLEGVWAKPWRRLLASGGRRTDRSHLWSRSA